MKPNPKLICVSGSTLRKMGKEDKPFARTRSELLAYIWYVKGFSPVNISKEGGHYALHIGAKTFATKVRCIGDFKKETWCKWIEEEYVPI